MFFVSWTFAGRYYSVCLCIQMYPDVSRCSCFSFFLIITTQHNSALHFAKGSFCWSGMAWCSFRQSFCSPGHKPIEKNQGCNHMVCSKAQANTQSHGHWIYIYIIYIIYIYIYICVCVWTWVLFDVYSAWLITVIAESSLMLIFLFQWLNFGRHMPRPDPLWSKWIPCQGRRLWSRVLLALFGWVGLAWDFYWWAPWQQKAAGLIAAYSGDTDTRTYKNMIEHAHSMALPRPILRVSHHSKIREHVQDLDACCYWMLRVNIGYILKCDHVWEPGQDLYKYRVISTLSDSACLGIENQIEAPIAHMLNLWKSWNMRSATTAVNSSAPRYYQCNIYDKQSKEGKHADEERSRAKAKHALDKYMFYFERFMDHDRGMRLTVTEEQDYPWSFLNHSCQAHKLTFCVLRLSDTFWVQWES